MISGYFSNSTPILLSMIYLRTQPRITRSVSVIWNANRGTMGRNIMIQRVLAPRLEVKANSRTSARFAFLRSSVVVAN